MPIKLTQNLLNSALTGSYCGEQLCHQYFLHRLYTLVRRSLYGFYTRSVCVCALLYHLRWRSFLQSSFIYSDALIFCARSKTLKEILVLRSPHTLAFFVIEREDRAQDAAFRRSTFLYSNVFGFTSMVHDVSLTEEIDSFWRAGCSTVRVIGTVTGGIHPKYSRLTIPPPPSPIIPPPPFFFACLSSINKIKEFGIFCTLFFIFKITKSNRKEFTFQRPNLLFCCCYKTTKKKINKDNNNKDIKCVFRWYNQALFVTACDLLRNLYGHID